MDGKTDLETLAAYAKELGIVKVDSGRQEMLEGVFNNIIFSK